MASTVKKAEENPLDMLQNDIAHVETVENTEANTEQSLELTKNPDRSDGPIQVQVVNQKMEYKKMLGFTSLTDIFEIATGYSWFDAFAVNSFPGMYVTPRNTADGPYLKAKNRLSPWERLAKLWGLVVWLLTLAQVCLLVVSAVRISEVVESSFFNALFYVTIFSVAFRNLYPSYLAVYNNMRFNDRVKTYYKDTDEIRQQGNQTGLVKLFEWQGPGLKKQFRKRRLHSLMMIMLSLLSVGIATCGLVLVHDFHDTMRPSSVMDLTHVDVAAVPQHESVLAMDLYAGKVAGFLTVRHATDVACAGTDLACVDMRQSANVSDSVDIPISAALMYLMDSRLWQLNTLVGQDQYTALADATGRSIDDTIRHGYPGRKFICGLFLLAFELSLGLGNWLYFSTPTRDEAIRVFQPLKKVKPEFLKPRKETKKEK